MSAEYIRRLEKHMRILMVLLVIVGTVMCVSIAIELFLANPFTLWFTIPAAGVCAYMLWILYTFQLKPGADE